MAIDSAAKRTSALYFHRHRKGRLIPDGAISGVDLQDCVGFYRGIAAIGTSVVTLETVSVTQPGVTVSSVQPGVTVSMTQTALTITVTNDLDL